MSTTVVRTDRSHRGALLRIFPIYIFIIISTLCHDTIAFATTHSTSTTSSLHPFRIQQTTTGSFSRSSAIVVINQASALSSSASSEAEAATSSSSSSSSNTNNNKKNDKVTTLTKDTTWRLRILLNGIITTKGRKLSSSNSGLFVVEGSFIEEDGYEPPQGYFQPLTPAATAIHDENVNSSSTTLSTSTLEIINSRWKLSEDPDDPKDGLWIWGLFKEPLYPYMLLQMETRELVLSSSKDGLNDDSIPPLKLYAQISHIRTKTNDKNKNKNKDAMMIGGGRRGGEGVELKTANLNIRVLEQISLPGTTVDLYEEEAVGQITFQPIL